MLFGGGDGRYIEFAKMAFRIYMLLIIGNSIEWLIATQPPSTAKLLRNITITAEKTLSRNHAFSIEHVTLSEEPPRRPSPNGRGGNQRA